MAVHPSELPWVKSVDRLHVFRPVSGSHVATLVSPVRFTPTSGLTVGRIAAGVGLRGTEGGKGRNGQQWQHHVTVRLLAADVNINECMSLRMNDTKDNWIIRED